MWFADFALRRPYTIIASLILVCLMGIGAGLRMPVDIFPEIDIPVVSVVWTYQGMSAPDIRDRILTLHQRRGDVRRHVFQDDKGAARKLRNRPGHVGALMQVDFLDPDPVIGRGLDPADVVDQRGQLSLMQR